MTTRLRPSPAAALGLVMATIAIPLASRHTVTAADPGETNFLASSTNRAAAVTLIIQATGFRNSQGLARATLFSSEAGFPLDHTRAIQAQSSPITNQQAVLAFTNLPPGDYAAALLHDENSNGKMDTSWLGIPKEGFGASNNARGRAGPPTFAAARFTLHSSTQTLSLAMAY